jgi:hypothetical protein
MTDNSTTRKSTRGRTFWDFCAERPVMLMLAILLVGISSIGVVVALRAEGVDAKFYIGPQASEPQ